MINSIVFDLMKSFPRSFVNSHGDFIAHLEANEYFILSTCSTDLEVKCKVLEWLSRAAYKTQPFRTKKKNDQFNKFMLDGINTFLGTNFSVEEIGLIYQELGNQVNRRLTTAFIHGGYDINLLISKSEGSDG